MTRLGAFATPFDNAVPRYKYCYGVVAAACIDLAAELELS